MGGDDVMDWKRWRNTIVLIFAVLGPGFITANVDNDAGGIYTYATAGAQFGYGLLWTMIPMAVMLTFAQEISARMGVGPAAVRQAACVSRAAVSLPA